MNYESNGSLPPGLLWLRTPAGWLPRTGIICGTQRNRRRGKGGQGDRSPPLGLGDNPPHFLLCLHNLLRKEVPKLAENCTIFSAKLISFWGKPPDPQLGRAQPLPRPHPFTLLNIYPPLLTWLRRHCPTLVSSMGQLNWRLLRFVGSF